MAAARKRVFDKGSALDSQDTLNKLDLISIEAMIAYAAHTQKTTEAIVLEAVFHQFKITSLIQMPHFLRETAIRFLADFRVAANSL